LVAPAGLLWRGVASLFRYRSTRVAARGGAGPVALVLRYAAAAAAGVVLLQLTNLLSVRVARTTLGVIVIVVDVFCQSVRRPPRRQ